jgi:hypothetical protein
MRTRLALVLAAAAFAVAVPAHASTPIGGTPYCATALANAGESDSSSCTTQGPAPVACRGCGVRRTVDVVVATGAVAATLTCDGAVVYGPVPVAGPAGHAEFGVWGGYDCALRLTSTQAGTSAVGTSSGSYVVDVE